MLICFYRILDSIWTLPAIREKYGRVNWITYFLEVYNMVGQVAAWLRLFIFGFIPQMQIAWLRFGSSE